MQHCVKQAIHSKDPAVVQTKLDEILLLMKSQGQICEEFIETFGIRLKRLRERKNLSVKELAEAIKTPVTTYREWENGRKIVGEEPYILLSHALDVSIYELLTGEKSPVDPALQSLEVMQAEIQRIKQHLLSR